MDLKHQIETMKHDAAGLEQLYREILGKEREPDFKEAIRQCAAEQPDNLLFQAWAHRLDVPGPVEIRAGRSSTQKRRWGIAITAGAVLGIVYALFSGNTPPVPVPGEARPLFWIGWSPALAITLLLYLAIASRSRLRHYLYAGVAVVPVAIYTAAVVAGRTDDVANLIALHLPLVAWAALGAAVAWKQSHPERQWYAYMVKSVETVLVAGIFLGAGGIFVALTYGIFEVLGIQVPEKILQTVAAWGIGAVPVLALATVYDPAVAPIAQDWTSGLTRILNILTKLLLPLAIAVLVVYLFWFLPTHFWRPFQEREVLIIYNATILAVLVLLTVVAAGPFGEQTQYRNRLFCYGVRILVVLITLLNLYALSAIVTRTVQMGITPNRYAVLGWNLVTFIMLMVIAFKQWKNRSQSWISVLRESIGRVSILAVLWTLWVVVVLPLSFG